MANNEWGDFQTPLALALQCLRVAGLTPRSRVFEPTCGSGSFLAAAAILAPDCERAGLEIQPAHVASAAAHGRVSAGNIFTSRLDAVRWASDGPLFVIGNPPWVTSAELNRMDSANLPPKENFKGAKGLDAILGSANFDVCEYVLLKVLNDLRAQRFTLGMLCKTQVARNVIEYAATARLPVAHSALYRVDAMKWFGAAVDACWFVLSADPRAEQDYTTAVHADVFSPAAAPVSRFGVVGGQLVSDVERYAAVGAADGACPYVWRSGLKHDAASVFELAATPQPAAKDGTPLDLEPQYVFPFLKSTDLFRARHDVLSRWVVVPQLRLGAETASLAAEAPKLWGYLTANAAVLDGRRSSVYRNRPRFSVFGHGDYTYAPYKVAISGLHKRPAFRLVAPLHGRPVVLDDTCYFLPFADPTEAAVVTAALNSEQCTALIESLAFWDAKRPITKKLLARVDVNRLGCDPAAVLASAARYGAAASIPFDAGRAAGLIGQLGSSAWAHRPAAALVGQAGSAPRPANFLSSP